MAEGAQVNDYSLVRNPGPTSPVHQISQITAEDESEVTHVS